MSSITGDSTTEKSNTPLYAAGVFLLQAFVFGAPLLLRAGAIETRLGAAETTIERNRGYIDDVRERLVRIETKLDQAIEAHHASKVAK